MCCDAVVSPSAWLPQAAVYNELLLSADANATALKDVQAENDANSKVLIHCLVELNCPYNADTISFKAVCFLRCSWVDGKFLSL